MLNSTVGAIAMQSRTVEPSRGLPSETICFKCHRRGHYRARCKNDAKFEKDSKKTSCADKVAALSAVEHVKRALQLLQPGPSPMAPTFATVVAQQHPTNLGHAESPASAQPKSVINVQSAISDSVLAERFWLTPEGRSVKLRLQQLDQIPKLIQQVAILEETVSSLLCTVTECVSLRSNPSLNNDNTVTAQQQQTESKTAVPEQKLLQQPLKPAAECDLKGLMSPLTTVKPQVVNPAVTEQKNVLKTPKPRRNRDIRASVQSSLQAGSPTMKTMNTRVYPNDKSAFLIQVPRKPPRTGCKCKFSDKSMHDHLVLDCPSFARAVPVKKWRLLVQEYGQRRCGLTPQSPQSAIDELSVSVLHDILDEQILGKTGDFDDYGELRAVGKRIREAMPLFENDCDSCVKALLGASCNSYCELMLKHFGIECSGKCAWPSCVKSTSRVTAH